MTHPKSFQDSYGRNPNRAPQHNATKCLMTTPHKFVQKFNRYSSGSWKPNNSIRSSLFFYEIRTAVHRMHSVRKWVVYIFQTFLTVLYWTTVKFITKTTEIAHLFHAKESVSNPLKSVLIYIFQKIRSSEIILVWKILIRFGFKLPLNFLLKTSK